MAAVKTRVQLRLQLRTFEAGDALPITHWVRDDDELRRLAPGTEPPLTPEKIIGWKKSGGRAFTLVRADDRSTPIGYGELNPMLRDRDHLWLGHAIVSPDERGRGIGTAFVTGLARLAFDRLGAQRISLIVFPENAAAIECYRRVGFAVMGEEYHVFGGTRYRLLRMQISPVDVAPLRGPGDSCA